MLTGVVHGRFQVFHLDHLVYVKEAKKRCRRLVVGVTNPDPSLTLDDPADPERSLPRANPLTYYERQGMITDVLLSEGWGVREFAVVPFPVNRPELFQYYVPLDAVFFLTIYDDWGRRKLKTFRTLGLKTDVLWDRPLSEKAITGTDIRRRLAEGGNWRDLVPPAAARFLDGLDLTGRL